MKDSKCGNFACKLHSLLNNPTYSDIICWSDKNTVIEIVDELRMEKEVLPHYFRQSKYQSFIRQLNLYGFKKVKSQRNSRFTHPQLLEGNSLSSILAVKSKKIKTIQNDEKLRDSNKVEEIQSYKSQQKKENFDQDAPSTSLAHNRNSQQQTQKGQKIHQINSAYFPHFLYFAFSPYFAWNLPENFTNNSINNQVPQFTGDAEILQQN